MELTSNALWERRDAIDARLNEIAEAADAESRSMTEPESTEVESLVAERRSVTTEASEIDSLNLVEARALAARAETARINAETRSGVTVNEQANPVYRKGDASVSYFRDMFTSRFQGDRAAGERLIRSQETRAGDMTTVAGAGGEFAPPLWLVEDFVAKARAGRPTADAVNKQVLPSGVSSINLPAVSTGAAVGAQSTQNTALTDTPMTTSSVTGTIATIGGKQIVSMQLLQQSGIPFDQVILSDLARAYATQIDTAVLTAISGLSGSNAVTVTATTPTGATSLYSGLANAIQLIQTNRFESPDTVVMHPRRWASLLGAVDTANRPLVVPGGPAFNELAQPGDGVPFQSVVGTIMGLRVITDASVTTAKGASTNQDEVYVFNSQDLWLYESPLQSQSFDATYADQASILFRVLGYYSFIPNRYPKAVAVLGGAGLVPPTF